MTITLCNVEQAVGTSLVPRPPRPAFVTCNMESILLVPLFVLQATKAGCEGLGTRLQWDSTVFNDAEKRKQTELTKLSQNNLSVLHIIISFPIDCVHTFFFFSILCSVECASNTLSCRLASRLLSNKMVVVLGKSSPYSCHNSLS